MPRFPRISPCHAREAPPHLTLPARSRLPPSLSPFLPARASCCYLAAGGAAIDVTDANKGEWLQLLLRHKLVDAVRPAADAFGLGLVDVLGGVGGVCPLLCLLSAKELSDAFGGRGVSRDDVIQWRGVSEVAPGVAEQVSWPKSTPSSSTHLSHISHHLPPSQASWLFDWLESDECNDELRGHVLYFATGSARMARGGVGSFTIAPADGGDERLPSSHTCANLLQLPSYSNRYTLQAQMRTAAENCQSFQFA